MRVGADERVGGRGEELVLWSVWGDGADGGDWVGEMILYTINHKFLGEMIYEEESIFWRK